MAVRLDAVSSLDSAARSAMRALLDRHFHGVDEQTFADDLHGKSHVLRLFATGGTLIGFSTIGYRRSLCLGEDIGLLISGDTIVDPAAWSAASLGPAWVAGVLDLHAANGGGTLWWLLLTSGVRTYRYLTACLERYAPAPPDRFDPEAAALLPVLAREVYGTHFDAGSGIVRLPRPQRLRQHLVDQPGHLLADPAMRCFVEHNPGHADGDELVSLCRLSAEHLTPTGRLALRRGRQLGINGQSEAAPCR